MPKKTKGKKGGKGKTGKKGKKTQEKEEAALKMGLHNSNLWEAQLTMMDLSRKHHRDIANSLANENETMRDQMRLTEKDTIDVVTFLKKQDADKDADIDRLQQNVKTLKMNHRKTKDELVGDFTREKRQLDDKLSRKESELEIVRHELNQVKEFRKKKTQMQKELEEIKEAMISNEREHKDTVSKLELKFFEEKMRLQQESNKKIDEIATRAQEEALKSLDETNRNVYKENIELIESLRTRKQEMDELQRLKEQLLRLIANTSNDKELNEILIKEKLEQVHKQNNVIRELKEKIQILESSLTQFIQEFDVERKNIIEESRIKHESSRIDIIKLQRGLELKTKEMNKVRKLAKIIIEQRTELETFFLDALQHVKKQIALNRLQYRKDAFSAYQNRMLNAHHGQGDYPRIRTFNETFHGYSTNSVFHDLEEATKWTNLGTEVDIADLTWEQKEQVLRALFIRMNARKANMTELTMNENRLENENRPLDANHDSTNNVFLTQGINTTQNGSSSGSRSNGSVSDVPKLPQITATATT
ncbi:unnamed protein product [Rotaria magnacalcarata]|uniref:Basal body-orientation factor 1 n=4 Tax=Rotaria magnacalcarata TaxID=392030 RepID=A0A816ZCB2_9BILA|nr:unnamed protein product [Rotaria magnacalcarata]CAF4144088.1 unnamed protein product [Rotaria magnacalcarata]